jgi:transposase
MSLHPDALGEVPPDTAAAARAAFRKGCLAMRLREEFGTLYTDAQFAALYPRRGQPALAPWRLALVSVLQFCEGLTDVQAADAVRARIDWKYALGLPLTDPGFDASVLCEFRARLVAGGGEAAVLQTLLTRCRERGLLKAGGRQRTDSTHVLAAIRGLNRLECAGEAMRHALNALTATAPVWVAPRLDPAWPDRYGLAFATQRLPTTEAARRVLAAQIGRDGIALLTALDAAPGDWAWLREIDAVATLRRIWWQQFHLDAAGEVGWRGPDDVPPPGTMIGSPYDPDARLGRKRDLTWFGAKVHLTESHDADAPHLITHVATTAATVPDGHLTDPIQADLAAQGVLPAAHTVDTGYVDAGTLVSSRARGVDLVGPVPPDTSWQARAGQGFDVGGFAVDWDRQTATCPGDRTSVEWGATRTRHGQPVITIGFAAADCRACARRPQCTTAVAGPRKLTVRPEAEHRALQAARQTQRTPEFAAHYAGRAGIEGTIAQGVRVCGLRRARYVGLPKLHLEHLLIATALNVKRLWAWWSGEPLAQTRRAPFVALAAGS